MYGVIKKKTPKFQTCHEHKNDCHGADAQVKPCPKCGEDFVMMHSYGFNPLLMRTGPKPWTDRKDQNF